MLLLIASIRDVLVQVIAKDLADTSVQIRSDKRLNSYLMVRVSYKVERHGLSIKRSVISTQYGHVAGVFLVGFRNGKHIEIGAIRNIGCLPVVRVVLFLVDLVPPTIEDRKVVLVILYVLEYQVLVPFIAVRGEHVRDLDIRRKDPE